MPTWVRVRDIDTGHEYDVLESALPARRGVEVLPDYPTVSGPGARPRPAKPRTDKAGKPAAASSTSKKTPASKPADTEETS